MKIVKNSLTLSLLALLALSGFSTLSAKEQPQKGNNKQPKEWYISARVSVTDPVSGKLHKGTNPAVFGKIVGSKQGKDKDDVGTFGSVVTRPAAVVFIHSDWGDMSGEYHSDYHGPGQADSWGGLTVFSSVPAGEVTLELDGLYELTPKQGKRGWNEKKVLDSLTLEDIKLIDTETSEVIQAVTDGKLNTHSFTMGAKGFRTFTVVLGSANAGHFAPQKGTQRYINLSKRRAKRAKSVAAQDNQGHKGIGPPPF